MSVQQNLLQMRCKTTAKYFCCKSGLLEASRLLVFSKVLLSNFTHLEKVQQNIFAVVLLSLMAGGALGVFAAPIVGFAAVVLAWVWVA